jgi:Xaa-Pro aminopeptidase
LGLDLHEEPRISATVFRAGQVFTVEPGLYYPGIGGARHEDVVAVTRTGCQRLARLDIPLEL